MTAALERGEWSAARPGCTLPPGKTQYPFYRRLGGLQGRFGRAENLVTTGIFFIISLVTQVYTIEGWVIYTYRVSEKKKTLYT